MSVYDRIVDTAHFAELLEIEALTNPRVREEAGDFRKVRAKDAVSGSGTTPIMASFAYTAHSRFSDGSFGVYYASCDEATALAETIYHKTAFLRATNEPSIDLDERMYRAAVSGKFDDIRARSPRSKLYDPDDYAGSQRYGGRVYAADMLDGILYRSVRRPAGECVAVFRPRCIAKCRMHKYLRLRWDGTSIVNVAVLTSLGPR
ncbi:MAG: RES family NAD+ phosphorylase [Candidatus Eremiobacteraeota bacterium]|nr:RES family NAD+ phosphorylase [Candidatus Eremiobacteraeota bacterium]MBV8375337.1 RES family NAD+ phosphorylase [Candidatus Eremiobacteraeota bacterium]